MSLFDARRMASNSGASFRVADGLISKTDSVNGSKLRDQMVWLAELHCERERFPAIQHGRWSPSGATYTSNHFDGDPLCALIGRHAQQHADLLLDVVCWVTKRLHSQQAATACYLERLVEQSSRRLHTAVTRSAVISRLFSAKEIRINAFPMPGIQRLLSQAMRYAARHGERVGVKTHGDLHTGNILISLTPITRWQLIDPRGRYYGGGPHFDSHYDWGKLLHDLYCLYNCVVYGALSARAVDSTSLYIHHLNPERKAGVACLRRHVVRFLDEQSVDYKLALICAGLLTLGALPFHQSNVGRCQALAAVGCVALYQGLMSEEDGCRKSVEGDCLDFLMSWSSSTEAPADAYNI